MDKSIEWIEDLLGAVEESANPDVIGLLHKCGCQCAMRKNALVGIRNLKQAATNCKERKDYIRFLRDMMPVRIEEASDGIIMFLGKDKCTCPMGGLLKKNADRLCECTKGHEMLVWSEFFGKPVDIEILESHLRGGKDCVIKIKV